MAFLARSSSHSNTDLLFRGRPIIIINIILDLQVYALTGGLAPLMPAIESNHVKQRKAQSQAQSENEKVFLPSCICLSIYS